MLCFFVLIVKLTSIDRARQTGSSATCFSCGTSVRANHSMEYLTKLFFVGCWNLSLINFIDHDVRDTVR
jgi:hypothetical protein